MDKIILVAYKRLFFSLSLTKIYAFRLVNLSQNNSVPIYDVQWLLS